MKQRKAFTLIELLVVIAIIALLLSIVMPSFRLAKAYARKTMCQSNLRQWGLIWNMYLDEFNSVFPSPHTSYKQHWFSVLRHYYQDDRIRCCPTATDLTTKNQRITFAPWGPMPASTPDSWWEEGDYGSYGINSWASNPPNPNATYLDMPGRLYWGKRTAVGNPFNVPLMLDSWWVDSWPVHVDPPPAYEEGNNINIMMQRFCLNRHNGYVVGLFMDASVSPVGLKSLWYQKWHKEYDIGYAQRPAYPWPEWMQNFK